MAEPVDPKGPKGAARTTWRDAVDENGNDTQEDPKTSKYYEGRVVHNDGSVTTTLYERGTNRVVRESEGKPDTAQQKKWEDEKPKQSTPQDPDVDEANKRANRQNEALENERTWNAANGGFRETHLERREREAKESKEKNAPKPASPVISTRTIKDETTGQTITVNKHADNTETRAESTTIAKPDKPQDIREADGRITRIHPDGRVEELRGPTPEKPVTRTDKEGRTFVQVKDPTTGELSEKEIPRTEINNAPPVSATGWTPDLTKPSYGLQERYAELARRQSLAPTDPDYLTASQAKSLYDQDKAVAEVELARSQGITTVQSGIHGQDITQRGQDQGVVNQRLTSSANATTSALAAARAGHHGGAASMQLINLYHAQADRYGGLKDVPREPLPPALARINALDPFGPGGATSAGSAAASPPQPAAVPDTGPLPMLPPAPSATPLPVGLTNIPPAAGLPVPAAGGLPDSSAGLTGGPLAGPSVQPVMAGFDPRQIAGLDPRASMRQQIIRQHFAGLMGGGF